MNEGQSHDYLFHMPITTLSTLQMCYLQHQQFYMRTFNRLRSINKDMGRPQFPYMGLVRVNGLLQAEVYAPEGLGKRPNCNADLLTDPLWALHPASPTQVGVFTLGAHLNGSPLKCCLCLERRELPLHSAHCIFRFGFDCSVQWITCSDLQKWPSHLVSPPTHDHSALEYSFSCKIRGDESSIARYFSC